MSQNISIGLSTRLVNVPAPRFYESVSCWLSRVALSQGTNLRELLSYLGVEIMGDIDRQLYESPRDSWRLV